jgi:hypothetical protein
VAKVRRRIIGATPIVGAALALASCGGEPPSHLVAESAHFRLFVGDGLDLLSATGLGPDDALVALETNHADTRTMLGMPEGRIDYHVLGPADVEGRCGGQEIAACQDGLSVYTTRVVDQHELNHAYMALRTSHRPTPLLLEGLADAVGCGDGGSAPPPFGGAAPWRDVVAYASYVDIYGPGRLLVRHLLLTQGPEAFLRYYAQAPDTRDPTIFAANFTAFWSKDLDGVWAAMQSEQPAWGPKVALPICPCSLPAWTASPSAAPIASTPAQPYWTWPALGGDTVAWAGNVGAVSVSDCARRDFAVAGFGVLLARMDGPPLDGKLYSNLSAAAIARGRFLVDACADAQAYPIPPSPMAVASVTELTIAAGRPLSTATSLFLALDASTPVRLSGTTTSMITLCPSCDFNDVACGTLPPTPNSTPLSGRVYLRWDIGATSWPYAVAGLRVLSP